MRRGKENGGNFAVSTSGGHHYGDPAFNRGAHKAGMKRLLLHTECLRFIHSATAVENRAPLPGKLDGMLGNLQPGYSDFLLSFHVWLRFELLNIISPIPGKK